MCGREFARAKHARYCSPACKHQAMTHPHALTCAHCGQSFTIRRLPNQRYCSRACVQEAQRRRVDRVCRGCGRDFTVTARQSDSLGNRRTRTFPVHVDAPPPVSAVTQPAAAGQPPAVAPSVKLTAPRCPRKLAKSRCKAFLVKRSTWKTVRGSAANATRVELTVKRAGAKPRVVKATVRNGKWAVKVSGLKRGATTFTARGFAADGAGSKAVAKKVRLR